MLYSIGRVCIKLAGRDAGKYCVIVDELEKGFVTIDGQTRRRKCNVLHLEPTKQSVSVAKGADSAAVAAALKDLDIEVAQKGSKRSPSPRTVKQHKQHSKEKK